MAAEEGVDWEGNAVSVCVGIAAAGGGHIALLSQLAEIQPGDRVLEVGTGSGYQAAVLAEMGAEGYSSEIVEEL